MASALRAFAASKNINSKLKKVFLVFICRNIYYTQRSKVLSNIRCSMKTLPSLKPVFEKIKQCFLHHVSHFVTLERGPNQNNWSHGRHNLIGRYTFRLKIQRTPLFLETRIQKYTWCRNLRKHYRILSHLPVSSHPLSPIFIALKKP